MPGPANLCPRCGHNLAADAPIERDGWFIDPFGRVEFQGRAIRLRPSWASILHTLASTGAVVTPEALTARFTDNERRNTVCSHLSQLRRHLRAAGLPDPIITERRHGYRWHGLARVNSTDLNPVVHGGISA